MAALLLIAHEPLASAFAQVATHAFPDCGSRLRFIDVAANASPEALEQEVRAAVATLAPQEVLILVDAFGATPCNVAMRVADGTQVRVVAGVSVPMLWRSLCYADESLDRLVPRAVDGAVQGALQVSSPRRLNQSHSFPPHAQDPHHDQQ